MDTSSNELESISQSLTSDPTEQEARRLSWKPLAGVSPKEGGQGSVHFVDSLDAKTRGALKVLKGDPIREASPHWTAYPPAIVQLKGEGDLTEDCRHRPVPYLNNVLEQDHRAIKRRVNASQHFRSFCAARRTLAGYEAIHMIRKGQASGSASAPGIGSTPSLYSRSIRYDLAS